VLYAREDAGELAEALGWLPADRGHARRLAVQAIAELRQPDAARTLARALVRANGEHPVGDEEAGLLRTLLEAAESSDVTSGVIEELLSALAAGREVVADRAEELLADLAPDSVDGVIAELSGGKGAVRAAAVLGRIKDSRTMEPLVDALGHRDARVRAEAAAALGELRDPSAVDPLMRATRDPDHNVRAQAGWALDRLGTVAVMVGVSHLVRPMIHEAVNEAIQGLPGPADPMRALPRGDGQDGNGQDERAPADPTMMNRLARFLDRVESGRGGEEPPAT